MKTRTASRIAALSPVLLALLVRPALANGWEPPLLLDPRDPLEIGAPSFDATLSESYGAVVFDGELDLMIVNFADTVNPQPRLEDVFTGATFAIGSTATLALPVNLIGGSFVDGAFDLRFWTCAPPCVSVTVHPVDTVQTWVDSSSGAAGPDLLAGGLNYALAAYQTYYSSNGGAGWTPFRTIAPAGGIYAAFDGGERASFFVDPAATDRSSALNCLFYERLVGGGTATEKRLNCATGTTPAFDVLIATDVPNAARAFDRFVENLCRVVRPAAPTPPSITCVFNRRQSADSWVSVRGLGGADRGLSRLGPVPPGTELFGYAGYTFDEVTGVFSAAGQGLTANEVWINDLYQTLLKRPGPAMTPGPAGAVAFAPPPASDYRNRLVAAFYRQFLSPPPATGLYLSVQELPRFFDGVESGDAQRWSVTVP